MKVTRAVIEDLLPVYLDGEASRDTQALVEAYLNEDPELRSRVALFKQAPRIEEWKPAIEKPLEVLEETRRRIRQQKWWQFFAILLSLMPLTFAFREGEVLFLLIRDNPLLGLCSWLLAGICWICYWRSSRL